LLAGRRYPEPIIDPAAAQKAARDAVWALRRSPGHKDEASTIAARHASRSARRAPPRSTPQPKPSDQMSFDL
jgi:deoxyribodipyrimidine photo-lyase